MKIKKELIKKEKTHSLNIVSSSARSRLHQAATFLLIQIVLVFNYCSISFAADYAKNGAKWLLEQISWVVIVAVVIILLKNLVARNTVASITTVIVGGIIIFFTVNPEILKTMGTTIANIIMGSGS